MYHMDEFDCYRIYTHVSTSYGKKTNQTKNSYTDKALPLSHQF